MSDSSRNPRYEYETVEVSGGADTLTWWLKFTVVLMVVVLLTVVIYGLMVGMFAKPTPRTATEARLVVLENSVQDVPDSGEARRDYVRALMASDQEAKAISTLERAREDITDDQLSWLNLAEVDMLWINADYEGVLEVSEQAIATEIEYQQKYIADQLARTIKVGPEDWRPQLLMELYVYRARAAGATEEWQMAADALTDALSLDSRQSDLFVLRADAYKNLGEIDLARADLEQALLYIPDHAGAKQALELLDQ